MSLFIRDPEVNALAEEVRRITHARTKTEAVRRALEAQLEAIRNASPLQARLARARILADSMGPSDPDFDMKGFSDALWSDA